MCTLIVLYGVLDSHPIVALHNRYAPKGSVEAPPRAIRGGVYIAYCPVEVATGGTWVGFNDRGLFVAVTDQHTGEVQAPRRSRGLLILDVLTGFRASEEAIEYVRSEASKGYKKANYVILDERSGYHVLFDDRIYVRKLDPGVHLFTNLTMHPSVVLRGEVRDGYEKAEARRSRAIQLAADLNLEGSRSLAEAIEKLKLIASDHGGTPGELSICYHGGGEWYMSSSTLIAVGRDGQKSRILYCRGNPCSSEFVDYSRLLASGPSEIRAKNDKLERIKVALCVTGSVAAIEAPKLARELRRHGAKVICYMTGAGVKYGVSPEVMRWATSEDVVTELTGRVEHLEDYDLVIIYPATLNTVCKVAFGVADNAVTTLCAATPVDKLLIAPAMNLKLYDNPAFREALARLEKLGATIIGPRIEENAAKVATVEATVDNAIRKLSVSRLKKRGVLILAGPTRYDLDAVRYVSNRATGAIGYWLAKEAFWRGCDVKVVYGPGTVSFPSHIAVIRAYSTEDMLSATLKELDEDRYDVAIFSAAILDFKPREVVRGKVKSGTEWRVELIPTPKVIKEIRTRHSDLFTVGFKLEYEVADEELIASAKELLRQIAPGIVVANDLAEVSEGRHKAYIVSGSEVREFDGPKSLLAREVLDIVEKSL